MPPRDSDEGVGRQEQGGEGGGEHSHHGGETDVI